MSYISFCLLVPVFMHNDTTIRLSSDNKSPFIQRYRSNERLCLFVYYRIKWPAAERQHVKKKRCPKEGDKFVELNPGEHDWAVSEADCRANAKGKGLTMRSTPSLARPKGCSRGSGGYVWNDNFDTSVGCVNNNNIYCHYP